MTTSLAGTNLLLFVICAVLSLSKVNTCGQLTNSSRQVVEEVKAKAERGDPVAQRQLGVAYCMGTGLLKDYAEGFRWLEMADAKDEPGAAAALGWLYEEGLGKPKDSKLAARYYLKAAEFGNAMGQFGVSQLYEKGDGVERDLVQAYKWLNLVSSQDDSLSKHRDGLERKMTSEQIAEAQRLARMFKLRSTTDQGSRSTNSLEKLPSDGGLQKQLSPSHTK